MASSHFSTVLATVAAKAAATPDARAWAWSAEDCVEFAWFSVGQEGDAAIDNDDFDRHLAQYIEEVHGG